MKNKENAIKWNLEKYNCNKELYNAYIAQLFMENSKTHLISTFKDYLFYDERTEFFNEYYPLNKSLKILLHLLTFYEKSSYIFPNYTAIKEGKYIYKNIIKKQILINYLEDLEIQKNKDIVIKKIRKNEVNIKKNEKIFDTKLYNSILDNYNNSNINILFGIKVKKKEENIENDSIITLKKLINIINESNTRSVGTNTVNTNSYSNQKAKKGKKRNYISPKSIINSTNYTSNISNSNINNFNSTFKNDKKLFNNNYNINYINLNRQHIKNDNSIYLNTNLNTSNKVYIKVKKKFHKINAQNKMKSLTTNFNSSFFKSIFEKSKERKLKKDKKLFNLIKLKNKTINNKKGLLYRPIDKIKYHISKSSLISEGEKINILLTNLPIKDNFNKIKLKHKDKKINKKNNILLNHIKSKSKFDIKLNKGILIHNNNYNRDQKSTTINTDYNSHLYSSKKNFFYKSLNSVIYKAINKNNINKSNLLYTKYYKNKTMSLTNDIFIKDNNSKHKFYTNNISKKKISNVNLIKKKKKTNIIKSSCFNMKFASPLRNNENIFKIYSNNLINYKTLINDFKTIIKLKYFKKKNISDYKIMK